MNNEQNLSNIEGVCPVCHQPMKRTSPKICYCEHCHHNYDEQYLCPVCSAFLQQIKGCGAINYICQNDGLVSTSKVKFHYRPVLGE